MFQFQTALSNGSSPLSQSCIFVCPDRAVSSGLWFEDVGPLQGANLVLDTDRRYDRPAVARTDPTLVDRYKRAGERRQTRPRLAH